MAGDSSAGSASASRNKRLKITIPSYPKSDINDDSNNQLQPEQQSAVEDNSDSERCGICLSEGERKAIRGKIDSCDHFFCFVCIMEWAKVESRCPMCKRRFTSIHRPPKLGVFASERVINVPQRDQVYHLFGNATSGPSDPYREVKCSVCSGIADEHLLLLCDLCDSAAHTYCVGLGATVPEGDWFCNDCALSRSEHAKIELDNGTDNQLISGSSKLEIPSETNVSVFDIVRESNNPLFRGHNANISSLSNNLPLNITQSNGAGEVSYLSERSKNTVGNTIDTGARTLRLCRRVHNRIQALRENWRALQSRSISFSSSMVVSDGENHRKGKIAALCNLRSSESQSSSSSQQSASQNTSVEPKGDSYDTDKAWKMMNIAKSMQKNCRRTSNLNQTSKNLSSPGSVSMVASSSSGLDISKNQQNETRNEDRKGKQKHYQYYHKREKEKHKFPEMEKQKRKVINIEHCKSVYTFHSPCLLQSPSPKKVQIPNNGCHVNVWEQVVKNAQSTCGNPTLNSILDSRSCSTRLASSVLQGSSDSLDSNLKVGLSKSDTPGTEGMTRLEKSCSKRNDRKDDNVKSEIQSLVKLNLKLLSQDKKLGVEAFKEIARLATHTILAACGFHHSKSSVHSYPSSVCSHNEDIKTQHKSTLMPNSCRECFYVFVKNVVCSIMIEKGYHAGSL